MNLLHQQKELTKRLNRYRNEYYNNNRMLISDSFYDDLFSRLKEMEQITGVVYPDSPTITVGYEVKSKLKKVKHNHPMLSLDKTKNVEDLEKFFKDHNGLLMHKADGLTISLEYVNGELIGAETRGNGEIGEDVLHNARVFTNVPLKIHRSIKHLIVDGEAIIDDDTFDELNKELPEDQQFKHPRNLASGSVRQLDSNIAKSRKLKFLAWKMIKCESEWPSSIEPENYNSFVYRLDYLKEIGFDIIPYMEVSSGIPVSGINRIIEELKSYSVSKGYPIDGLVASYDDIEYGESLGRTEHHVRSQLAFKFEDDSSITTFTGIEWSGSKFGVFTPVALFKPIELDGTIVQRASIHNVSILKELQLNIGDGIIVCKANDVIPQIVKNRTFEAINEAGFYDEEKVQKRIADNLNLIPTHCPECRTELKIIKEGKAEGLWCPNPNCKCKLIGLLTHFVSKNAMNIEGLSEATIQFLVQNGWVNSFKDLYKLKDNQDIVNQWYQSDGFGKKSVDQILKSIEKSRNTTLDRLIYSLSIPMIGKTASKSISNYYNDNFDGFWVGVNCYPAAINVIDGIGITMADSFDRYIKANSHMIYELSNELSFEIANTQHETVLSGLTFVITGSVHHYKNRNELIKVIEANGGKVAGSVSKNTSYLINNDINSNSSKNKKARELGVNIISENDFVNMII